MRKALLLNIVVLATFVAMSASNLVFGADWFVAPDGNSGNAGTSWDAPIDMATAVGKAADDTFYLKAGLYGLSSQIVAKSDQTWMGGYPASATGTDTAGRDAAANPTILDFYNGGSQVANSVVFSNVQNVTMDGIVIQRGIRGVHCESGATVEMIDCIVRDCETSAGQAAGMYAHDADTMITLRRCKFLANVNRATSGLRAGAIGISNLASVIIHDSQFVGNLCYVNTGTYSSGAAIGVVAYGANQGSVKCYNSLFAGNGNMVNGRGGAVCLVQTDGGSEFVNCIFAGCFSKNPANQGLGGAIFTYYAKVDIVNCTFYGIEGDSVIHGAGANTEARVVNNIFAENRTRSGITFGWYNYSDTTNNLFHNANAGGEMRVQRDPKFETATTGAWTALPMYSGDGTSWTLLTDATASFTPGALEGMFVNPDTTNTPFAVVTSNTATQILIAGGLPAGIGSVYELQTFKITAGSGAVDKGLDTFTSVYHPDEPLAFLSTDIAGDARRQDGNGYAQADENDLGAYELAAGDSFADLYVKPTASGAADGSSWADACDWDYVDANAKEGDMIWIAAGTYVANDVYPYSGQTFLGGFPATGNPGIADRDPWTNVTTIDGQGTTRCFMLASGRRILDLTIDGLRLYRGYASSGAGGIRMYPNQLQYMTVRNCKFERCGSGNGGPAISAYASSAARMPHGVAVENSVFEQNTSNANYGLIVDYANYGGKDFSFTNCIFTSNSAVGYRTIGLDYGTLILNNSVFALNTCGATGEQVHADNMDYVEVTNNIFVDYSSPGGGAGNVALWTGATERVIGGNLFYNNDDTSNNLAPSDIVGSDPLFVSYTPGNLATMNFNLQAASPAIDMGIANDLLLDFAGNPRPVRANPGRVLAYPDAGAYEYQGTAAKSGTWHVKPTATGAGDGTSWADACDFDYATANAAPNQDIWLAAGTHTVADAFTGQWRLNIWGGFPATGDPGVADRDIATNVSIIDGQDTPRDTALILFGSGDDDSRIDGVTIQGGNNDRDTEGGNGRGGAIYVSYADVQITSCVIQDNHVDTSWGAGGGGISVLGIDSDVLIANCWLRRNTTEEITNTSGGNDGGSALHADDRANVTVRDCFVADNHGARGSFHVRDLATILMQNSVVAFNTVEGGGSGVWLRNGGEMKAVNCTYYGNTGTLIYAYSGTANTFTAINSLFAGNTGRILYNAANANDFNVGNCLFDQNTYTGSLVSGAVTDLGGNIANADYPFGAGGTWTLAGLADPAAYNFRLGAPSAAIDNASSTADADIPTVDLEGNARDVDTPVAGGDGPGNAYDIGAYERQNTSIPSVAGVYVDDDAAPGGDGSKGAPITSIASALGRVSTEVAPAPWTAPDKVFVAAGTYNEVLNMKSGIVVRGGYASDFNSRDLAANESIVDGQRVTRSTGVVNFDSSATNARIDGFTITGGRNNSDNGGGVRIDGATNAIVTSCTITANRAKGGYYTGGGGIGVQGTGAGVLIDGCAITSNSTYYVDSRWTYQYPGTMGGGVGCLNNTRTQIRNTMISGNMSCGGAGVGLNSAKVGLDNTIVADNRELSPSWWHGAGMFVLNRYDTSDASVTTLTNCTFYGNATVDGGSANAIRAFTYAAAAPVTVAMANTIIAGHGGTGLELQSYGVVGLAANLFDSNGNDVSLHPSNVLFADLGNNISTDSDLINGGSGVFTNPLFVDPANGDFTPGRGSAAIDNGLSSLLGYAATPYDFNRDARDYDVAGVGGSGAGNAYDIGAVENRSIVTADGAMYVDDDAAPGGDGTIGSPFDTLTEGVAATNSNWPNGALFVAGGTYNEQIAPTHGLEMRGGYSADFLSRDPAIYPSTIDGGHTTRTTALVRISGSDGVRVDGFTIRRGYNQPMTGGGVFVGGGGSAAITSCTISDNWSGEKDLVTDSGSYLSGGGGVLVHGSGAYALIDNCVLTSNTAWNLSGYCGSGLCAYSNADVDVRNTLFIGNQDPIVSHLYGTAIGASYGSSVRAVNCLFYDNPSIDVYARRANTTIDLIHCTMIGEGGNDYAVYSRGPSGVYVTVVNSIVMDYRYALTRTEYNGSGNYIVAYNSLFHNNVSDTAGGDSSNIVDMGGNISTDPLLGGSAGVDTNPMIVSLPGQGYGFALMAGSPAIDAGLTTDSLPADDYLRQARDASPDIGAYEYQVSGTPPVILVDPISITVDPGDTASLSVSAIGSPILSYQWEFNDGGGWVNVGTNSYLYQLDPAAESHEGTYRVTVTNDAGSAMSHEATVTVNDPPVITVEPVSVHTTLSGAASFSVTVTGSAPMTYQWQKDGGVVSADATHVITSTDTGSTLNLTNVIPTDVGVYRVQISNSAGLVRSVYVTLTVDGPVQVLKQPTTQTTAFGSPVEFSVFVTGTQPMTYTWNRNGSPLSDGGNISGSATKVLTLNPVGWSDSMGAQYQVNVTNALTPAGVDSVIVGIRLLPTGVSPWWEMMR